MRSTAPSLTNRMRRGLGRAALLLLGGLAIGAGPAAAADQPPPRGYAVGDFNADGFGDFTAYDGDVKDDTAKLAILFGSAEPGVAKVPSEGGEGIIIDTSKAPDEAESSWDFPLPTRVGDVDGDGFDDVVVTGHVNHSWIVYGAAGGSGVDLIDDGARVTDLIHEFRYLATPQVTGIGDFDGDGLTDFLQTRDMSVVASSAAALPKTGGAVIILGGPRTPTLETRGQGPRRVQVDAKALCTWRWVVVLPSYTCVWQLPTLAAIGDYDRDGKTDLYQAAGSFVIRGRTGNATFSGVQAGANTIAVPIQPQGTPWAPRVIPPPVDPGSTGTDGWALSGVARRLDAGSVLLASGDSSNTAGAIFDDRKTVDANAIVVDFDLQLVNRSGNGNGMTLAFASPSQGGVPRAANYGIGLGWVGNRGTAITLGTVKGTYTPSSNYVGIASGVVGRSGYPTFLQTAPAVSPLAGATNHITVKASGGVVTVAINGTERLRRTMTLPTDAYVGFTAGTSAARQDHIVSNVVIAKP